MVRLGTPPVTGRSSICLGRSAECGWGLAEDYEAAGEFEWAEKLMPGHPDPRVNLGLVMEAAGRNDEAMASYDAALEVWPGYLPAVQGAASLALRSGRRSDPRLAGWLDEVALRGDDGWREWARERRLRL